MFMNISRKTRYDDNVILNQLNQDLEEAGFAYDAEKDIFYSMIDCWQRDFGYSRLYDEASVSIGLIIDCEPIRFKYEGKDWLIQFWKGQYGLSTGGEIGIYVAKENLIVDSLMPSGKIYESVSAEDFIEASFILEKNGRPLFMQEGLHWWLTGFKLGEYSQPAELTMRISITLKDSAMSGAFADALKLAGYKTHELDVREATVKLVFGVPYTPQPFSRTDLTENIMQFCNKTNCRLYHFLTRNCQTTLDQLKYLFQRMPWLYRRALGMGKPMALFTAVNRKEVR